MMIRLRSSLCRRRSRSGAGFTLLEVMIALAILAMTAAVLVEIVTNNVRATNHSKLTTAATFLARSKMVDLEEQTTVNGFSENNETANGTFKDQGYPDFRWESQIERVELPTDMAQKTQAQAQEKSQNDVGKDPFAMMTGLLGGMMSSFIEPVRIGLEASVRRVTVRVIWDEVGRPDQSFEVVQYLTDPAKLDANMPGMQVGMPGAPGGAGAPGTGLPNPGLTPPTVSIPGLTK
jgi:type II secretion system protein I